MKLLIWYEIIYGKRFLVRSFKSSNVLVSKVDFLFYFIHKKKKKKKSGKKNKKKSVKKKKQLHEKKQKKE